MSYSKIKFEMFKRKKNNKGPDSSRKRIGAQVPGPDTPTSLSTQSPPTPPDHLLHHRTPCCGASCSPLPRVASAAHVTPLYSTLALRPPPPPHLPLLGTPATWSFALLPHTTHWHTALSYTLLAVHTQTHHGPKQAASKQSLCHVSVPPAGPGVRAEPSPQHPHLGD